MTGDDSMPSTGEPSNDIDSPASRTGGLFPVESLWRLFESLPPASTADNLLGRTIDGIRLTRFIADGGMGRVYEAEQFNPPRRVAVKVIRPGLFERDAIRRFIREVATLGNLQHPGITQIYSAGTYEAQGTELPYFVMELIADALPLTEYATVHSLSMQQRLDLFLQICKAIAYGHERGVVHRDLKPGNLLVDGLGRTKVIDFGVARSLEAGRHTTTLTDAGHLVGTLQYMSPERVAGHSDGVDFHSDVYALGAVLYELLTGRAPHDLSGKPLAEAARIVRDEEIPSLSSLNPSVPQPVSDLVHTCLKKDAHRRFRTAGDLSAAMERLALDRGGLHPLDVGNRRRSLVSPIVIAGIALAVALFCGIVWVRISSGMLGEGPGIHASLPKPPVDAMETEGPIVVNSIGMELKRLPGGTFVMGDMAGGGMPDELAHQVTLTSAFFIGLREVTNAQWLAVVGKPPSKIKDTDCPVTNVTWTEATDFCTRLSDLPDERSLGRIYRLPTEAEWEYACRAGTKTRWHSGQDGRNALDHAWIFNNSGEKLLPYDPRYTESDWSLHLPLALEASCRPHAVGTRNPNGFGLFDMHGNVYEWCSDWYGGYGQDVVVDPMGPADGTTRTCRGGSFLNTAYVARSSSRYHFRPSDKGDSVGFRVVCTMR